jgi:ankyrin repeat protein
MATAQEGYIKIVKVLLNAGADPNIENSLGFNALVFCLSPSLSPRICPSYHHFKTN